MAVIGEMHYLTIGGKTYSIPTSGGSTVSITRNLTSGTKSATITVDGTSYDIYSTNNSGGTVTSVRVQATSPVQSSTSTASSSTLDTTISLADGYGDTKNPYGSKTKNYVLAAPSNAAGNPSFRALVAADIPDLSGTYLTSHQSIKTLHSKTLTGTGDVTLSYSDVGAAASSHAHGNITSGGDITATAPTIANGDQIIINDNSTSKITNGPTFDGSTTTKALTPKGTWETFAKSSDIPTVPTNVSAFTNDSGYITSADVPEGASAYTGTISAVGTTASNGTNNGFARGDHVHNITKTTIDSTLGTGSGTTKFYREDGQWATPAYTTNTDEKLKIAAVTSGTTYYPIVAANSTTAANRQYDATGIAYTGTNGTANGTNGNALLTLGNSTASTSANWKKGTVRLYGTTAYYTDLVSGTPSANRTITFPNATGTVALTSDIPDVSSFVTSSGVTSIATTSPISGGTITSTGTISHATSGVGSAVTTAGFYKFKYDTYGHVTGVTSVAASDITGLVTIPTVPSNIVNTITTTAGAHTAITSQKGDVSFNVPTKTSHLTNDSGFITSDSDENVKSTAVTAATTNYIVGSTTSTTTTGGLSKHASAVLYTTADSGTSGYTQLRLGNTTATSSAGGKEGQIRLYGTNATYYVDLKAGAVASSNKTITFPNKTGTVALTTDIPDVSSFITDAGVTKITTTAGAHTAITNSTGAVSFNVPTKTSHLTNDSGFLTSYTDEKLKISSVDSAGTYFLIGMSTLNSIPRTDTGKVAYDCVYSTDQSSFSYLRIGYHYRGALWLGNKSGNTVYNTKLISSHTSTDREITLPDATGTIALTSDIPTYTATSPIDITNNVISHETSGVTAGTYDGGGVKASGFYVPSITVDANGHITSATDLGNLIPEITNSNSNEIGNLINAYTWAQGVRSYSAYPTYFSAGNTSKTVTISTDAYSSYSNKTYFRVVDVEAFDSVTKEKIIVDWSVNALYSNGSSITVTVSIASAHTNDIWLYILLSASYSPM